MRGRYGRVQHFAPLPHIRQVEDASDSRRFVQRSGCGADVFLTAAICHVPRGGILTVVPWPIQSLNGPDRIIAIAGSIALRHFKIDETCVAKQEGKQGVRSGDNLEVLAQRVPIDAGSKLFNLFVGALPDRKSAGEQAAPFGGKDKDAAAAIGRIRLNLQ